MAKYDDYYTINGTKLKNLYILYFNYNIGHFKTKKNFIKFI